MQSKLTLIGMYNYDPTLFSNLSMPAGVDTDIVRDEILIRSGEFEVLYSDPAFVKMLIGHWSKKHLRTFEKWFNALSIEYDPLNNYDRTEEYTDIRSGNGSRENTSGRKYSDNSIDNDSGKIKTSDLFNDISAGSSSGSEGANGSISENETSAGAENMIGSDEVATNKNSTSAGNSSGHTTGSTSPAQTTNTKTTNVAAYDSGTLQTKEQTTDALTLQVAGSDSSDTASNTLTNEIESGNNDRDYSENKNHVDNRSHTETHDDNKTRSENHVDNISHTGDHTEENTATKTGSRFGLDDQTSNEKSNNNETTQHRAHLFGNIGVTTSQQMLQSELDVQRFNLYEQIADIFVEEFCIMIY